MSRRWGGGIEGDAAFIFEEEEVGEEAGGVH